MSLTILTYYLHQARLLFNHLLDELFYFDIWNVGIINKKIENIEDLLELNNICWLPCHQPLAYIADPFIYEYSSQKYVIIENYQYRKRGQIYRFNLSLNNLESNKLILEEAIIANHHLSYPYILEVGRQIYCIPEMHEKKQCELYKLNQEGSFVLEKILITGIGIVDPTLFFSNDYWWLFFTDIQHNSNLKLFAYYATDLLGEWHPHSLNPLKCDSSCSRPAGKPFMVGDKLYRPAQDCSQTYGGAITINEIKELSPTTFFEIPTLKINPDPLSPYPDGIHHLFIDDDIIAIDAKKRTFDLFFRIKQFAPIFF